MWLVCNAGCLGCSICGEIKSLGPAGVQGSGIRTALSAKWVSRSVKPYGETRAQQLKSVRKKICEHKTSASHTEAEKVQATRKKAKLKSNVIDQQHTEFNATCNVFRTAYYLAKKNRPFSDHSNLIDLQSLNGVNVGWLLHRSTTCVS